MIFLDFEENVKCKILISSKENSRVGKDTKFLLFFYFWGRIPNWQKKKHHSHMCEQVCLFVCFFCGNVRTSWSKNICLGLFNFHKYSWLLGQTLDFNRVWSCYFLRVTCCFFSFLFFSFFHFFFFCLKPPKKKKNN